MKWKKTNVPNHQPVNIIQCLRHHEQLFLDYLFIPMNIHGRGSCKPFYRHKMVFTIKWLDTAYKMSGPNPNENTIFWGGLTPEHLELEPQNLYKTTGSLSKCSRHKSTDFTTSLRIIPFSHSFILFPMPPSANPGLSMGNFGIVWATCP